LPKSLHPCNSRKHIKGGYRASPVHGEEEETGGALTDVVNVQECWHWRRRRQREVKVLSRQNWPWWYSVRSFILSNYLTCIVRFRFNNFLRRISNFLLFLLSTIYLFFFYQSQFCCFAYWLFKLAKSKLHKYWLHI